MPSFFFVFEIIGTIAFAVSGAVKGIKYQMDVFGVCILGLVTGVGGGVIRDAIIGNTPVTAIKNPLFATVAIVASLITFAVIYALGKKHEPDNKKYIVFMFAADTLGLAVFTNTALTIARDAGISNTLALVFLGTVSGVGGGVLRDVFCGDVPYIFKKHIYAVASAAGALVNVIVYAVAPQNLAAALGICTVVIIRVLAAHFKWNLPKIKYFE